MTAIAWLARPAVANLLTTLVREERELSHELLDDLPSSTTLDHRWSVQHRNAHGLTYGTVRWTGPTVTLDSEKRWADARTLLKNNTIATPDRVAGLLLLLYAQRLSTITTLTPQHVTTGEDGQVLIQLWRTPLTVPALGQPIPLDRTVHPRHRTACRDPRQNARHQHQSRRRLATSRVRRLGRLRRRHRLPVHRTGQEFPQF